MIDVVRPRVLEARERVQRDEGPDRVRDDDGRRAPRQQQVVREEVDLVPHLALEREGLK